MKKIGSIILIAVLLLCGCSSTPKETPSEGQVVDSKSGEEVGSDKSKDNNKKADEVVVFEDPIFERYIRNYRGVTAEEDILVNELSEMTELVIDRRFVEMDMDVFFHKPITVLRMDLSDLKYFPNLTKLEIQNEIGDILYSLEAIGNCTKLTELSLRYNFLGETLDSSGKNINFNKGYYFTEALGYKTLYNILDKLPNLKTLDLGIPLSDNILAEIQAKIPKVTIALIEEYNISSYYSKYNNVLTTLSDLAVLSTDTTVVNMLLSEEEDIDEVIKKVATFEKLSILRIFSEINNGTIDLSPLKNHASLEEIVISSGNGSSSEDAFMSFETLVTIPNLKYLTFYGMIVSDKELSNLTHLKTLNLHVCEIDGLEFLSYCTSLYQLKLYFISSDNEDEKKLIESLVVGMNSQRNLQYLYTYGTGSLLNYCPEAIENMTQLRDFTSIEHEDEEYPYFSGFNLENCINLKRIVFSSLGRSDIKFDLAALQGLSKLESLWIHDCIGFENEDALLELSNLQSFKWETYNRGQEDIDNIGIRLDPLSSVLIKLPKLSAVSYSDISRLATKSSKPLSKDLVAINCKAFYDVGIYDEYYGRLNWMGKTID